jgi:hypothetical protein
MELRGEDFRQALDACGDAIVACEICAVECIELNGMQECLRACRDCITLATACMNFLARGGRLVQPLCGLTATACDEVAEACSHYTSEVLVDTAERCRECAERCRTIAAGAYLA